MEYAIFQIYRSLGEFDSTTRPSPGSTAKWTFFTIHLDCFRCKQVLVVEWTGLSEYFSRLRFTYICSIISEIVIELVSIQHKGTYHGSINIILRAFGCAKSIWCS